MSICSAVFGSSSKTLNVGLTIGYDCFSFISRLEPIGDLTPKEREKWPPPPKEQLFDFVDLGGLFSVKATAKESALHSLPVKKIDREQAAATAADGTQITGVEAYKRFIESARNRDHVRTMSYFWDLPRECALSAWL